MDKLEFAESLIRAPWIKKLQDRTFLSSIGALILQISGLYALWQTPGIPVTDKVNATVAVIAGITTIIAVFTGYEKGKDTKIATAALNAQAQVESAANSVAHKLGTKLGEALLPLEALAAEIPGNYGERPLIEDGGEEFVDERNAG